MINYKSILKSFSLLLIGILLVLPIHRSQSIENEKYSEITSKYEVGDIVRCSNWENSYWEGEVVKIVRDVVYQIELRNIVVDGALKLYLNPSECTGKKRLSYEDGKDYNKTKIWVHERCLN